MRFLHASLPDGRCRGRPINTDARSTPKSAKEANMPKRSSTGQGGAAGRRGRAAWQGGAAGRQEDYPTGSHLISSLTRLWNPLVPCNEIE